MTEPLRILIVEDEAIIQMYLTATLEDAGHTVVATAVSASDAIDKIKKTCPELVLLDLHLGDRSSGLDVARAVRHQDGLTIVFVTANALRLDDDMEGAAGVIAKPFSDRLLEGSLAYLEECMRRPPPALEVPMGLRLAPAYHARLEGLRQAM